MPKRDGTLEQEKEADEDETTTITQGDAYEKEAVVLRAMVVNNRGEACQLRVRAVIKVPGSR